jgi:hypothetical protein
MSEILRMTGSQEAKVCFFGHDIDGMTREELIAVVKFIGAELENTRLSAISSVRLMRDLCKSAGGSYVE